MSEFSIRPRMRKILDTGVVHTDQLLEEFTGHDHSSSSMTSALAFYYTHTLPTWHVDAACRDMDQSIFYGNEDRSKKARHHPSLTVDEVAKARSVCNMCPVQLQCLEYAISNREEFGIWGGSTAGQRRKWIKAFETELPVVYVEDTWECTQDEDS